MLISRRKSLNTVLKYIRTQQEQLWCRHVGIYRGKGVISVSPSESTVDDKEIIVRWDRHLGQAQWSTPIIPAPQEVDAEWSQVQSQCGWTTYWEPVWKGREGRKEGRKDAKKNEREFPLNPWGICSDPFLPVGKGSRALQTWLLSSFPTFASTEEKAPAPPASRSLLLCNHLKEVLRFEDVTFWSPAISPPQLKYHCIRLGNAVQCYLQMVSYFSNQTIKWI